ncbi:MAG: hypothetical protein JXL97_07610 [Bacteroidales bacterium]|nr:hypothetical protein [Bacteroidales bacterium]
MKNLLKFSFLLLAVLVAFSSCKKDKIDVNSEPSMSLSQDDNELTTLNMTDNELEIYGVVAPDFDGDQVEIKIITNAHPEGIIKTLDLSDEKTVEKDDEIIHFRSFAYDFKIAYFDDDTRDLIKIAADETEITVQVNDGFLSGTYPVNTEDILQFTYWNINSATLFIYGYDFDGTQAVSVEAWTSRDDTPIDVDLTYNDPTVYNGLPAFNDYEASIPFWDGFSSFQDTTLGIYYDQDTIFFKYEGKTYYSEHNVNTFAPLLEY